MLRPLSFHAIKHGTTNHPQRFIFRPTTLGRRLERPSHVVQPPRLARLAARPPTAPSITEPSPPPTPDPSSFKILTSRVLRALSSLELAITELLLIAFLSTIGTLIEQNKSYEYYQTFYPDQGDKVFGFITTNFIFTLGLDHVYTAPWYILSLGALGASLAACTATRQWPVVKVAQRWSFLDKPERVLNQEVKETLENARVRDVARLLLTKGYQVFLKDNTTNSTNNTTNTNKVVMYAFKGIAGRMAPIAVHAALLLTMGGTLVSSYCGWHGSAVTPEQGDLLVLNALEPASSVALLPSGARSVLHVNDFTITYMENGQVDQFYSDLSVLDLNGREVDRKTIFVNEPLRFGGVTAYQTDWGMAGVTVSVNGSPVVEGGMGGRSISGGGRSAVAAVPTMNAAASSSTTSPSDDDSSSASSSSSSVAMEGAPTITIPLASLEGTPGFAGRAWGTFIPAELPKGTEKPRGISIVARDFQSVAFYDSKGAFAGVRRIGSNKPIDVEGMTLIVREIIGSTGLELKSDPGVPIVYTGYGFLLIFSFLSFLTFSQVWAVQDGSTVYVGGKTNRGKYEFKSEMDGVFDKVPDYRTEMSLVEDILDSIPTSCVTISKRDLSIALSSSLSPPLRDVFGNLCELLGKLAQVTTQERFVPLRENFRLLSAAACGEPVQLPTAVANDPDLLAATLHTAEKAFLADFLALMDRGGYQLLTESDWAFAKSDDFLFSIPITIPTASYDDKLFANVWTSPTVAERFAHRAEITNRILLFHRGTGIMHRERDLYIWTKIDLLLEYLVLNPLGWLLRHTPLANRLLAGRPSGPRHDLLRVPQSETEVKIAAMRRTLRSEMPSVRAVLSKLTTKLMPTEPVLSHVVTLYRRNEPGATTNPMVPKLKALGHRMSTHPKATKPSSSSFGSAVTPTMSIIPPFSSNVFIRTFCDVPKADLEIALPDKIPHVGSFDYVYYAFTFLSLLAAIGGLFFGVHKRLLKGTGADLLRPELLLSPLVAILLRLYAKFSALKAALQNARDALQLLTGYLTDGAQEKALAALVQEVELLSGREMVLVYGVMLEQGGASHGMSKSEIQSACNEYLGRVFQIKAELAITTSLTQLELLGCVERREQSGREATFRAKSVQVAFDEANAVWRSYFAHETLTERAEVRKEEEAAKIRNMEGDGVAATTAHVITPTPSIKKNL